MGALSQTVLAGLLPAWMPKALQQAVLRPLALDKIERVYEAARSAPDILATLLDNLQVRYKAADADLAHIPRSGPVVVVANHPFGVLEGAVLATVLRRIRPDVRILANGILASIPELRDLLIPVDVFQGSREANASGIRRAMDYVRDGGLLVIFPAGAVSHFQWSMRAVIDPPWQPQVARLLRLCARGTKLAIVPAYVPGSNSLTFHAAGLAHPSFRTALLARELLNKRRATVEIRVGRPISPGKLAMLDTDRERIEYLRWRTYLLANRQAFRANTNRGLRRLRIGAQTPIASAIPPATLAAEIATLQDSCLLDQSGDLQVFLARADDIPSTLREIGRLREVTFRRAGEGTGQSIDLDGFDDRYLHLFLWDTARLQVAGAYRLTPAIQADELYTQTLFRFDQTFLLAMGPAVELGRSFIRAEYQKGFAPLLLLWKGIGKFIARNPQYKILFGPVSISNQYQSISRELIVAFLEKHASLAEWTGLVRSRNAPPASREVSRCTDVQELTDIIADVEATQGIPVLLRQYLKLGGRLLGFNVDPEFSNALDGLIVVDLSRTEPKLLERYLGKAEAHTILNFHKEPDPCNTVKRSSPPVGYYAVSRP